MKRVFAISVMTMVIGACSFQYDPAVFNGEFPDGSAGVRNFRSLFETYSVATGLDASNNAIRNYYATVNGRLSADGNASTVSASMLLASASLAGVFCEQFIAREATLTPPERRAHGSVNFSQNQSSLTEGIRREVIAKYAELFWRRAANETEMGILLAAMSDAEVGAALTATELRNILKVGCAATAGSLDAFQN